MLRLADQIHRAYQAALSSGSIDGAESLVVRLRDFNAPEPERDELWTQLIDHYNRRTPPGVAGGTSPGDGRRSPRGTRRPPCHSAGDDPRRHRPATRHRGPGRCPGRADHPRPLDLAPTDHSRDSPRSSGYSLTSSDPPPMRPSFASTRGLIAGLDATARADRGHRGRPRSPQSGRDSGSADAMRMQRDRSVAAIRRLLEAA